MSKNIHIWQHLGASGSIWERLDASGSSRPIFPNLEPLQILIEISHLLFMTFASSGTQCLLIHFPQSGAPPNPY